MWSLIHLDTVDSTNDECKRRAMAGAPDGLAVTAELQTRGKGRRGRSFQSLPGKGLYLSVLLRPQVPLDQVSQITAWVAVAVSAAIGRAAGLPCHIKWPNDILVSGKKLCGILTELGLETERQALSYVVVGIGINVAQTEADFGPELAPIATSLAQLGVSVRRDALAQALLEELEQMYRDFPRQQAHYLSRYRENCVTLNRPVQILRPDGVQDAFALDIDPDFALRVRLPDGVQTRVTSGEVSVRPAEAQRE